MIKIILIAVGLFLLLFYIVLVLFQANVQERRKKVNSLERYKMLSNEDKTNLTIYCIYDSIYDVVKNKNINIGDDVVTDIKELAYNLYLDDEYMNLSAPQIAFFLTECYAKDNSFMNKVADMDYSDILEAVDNGNYNFYKNEIER